MDEHSQDLSYRLAQDSYYQTQIYDIHMYEVKPSKATLDDF